MDEWPNSIGKAMFLRCSCVFLTLLLSIHLIFYIDIDFPVLSSCSSTCKLVLRSLYSCVFSLCLSLMRHMCVSFYFISYPSFTNYEVSPSKVALCLPLCISSLYKPVTKYFDLKHVFWISVTLVQQRGRAGPERGAQVCPPSR